MTRRGVGTSRQPRSSHAGATVWFTGLPAAGKSTLALRLERVLADRGVAVCRLDSDELRSGLNADLQFSPEDRRENIRRIGELAILFAHRGFVTLVASISPYFTCRVAVRRQHVANGIPFFECYVATPLTECIRRDPKNLYQQATEGNLPNVTGISAPYEPPIDPEFVITPAIPLEESTDMILERLLIERVVSE